MSPGATESNMKRDKGLSSPRILEGRDTASVAKYIKSKKCRNIVFMLGAGVSTAAGIPDFRSPDTGLYANLAHLGLPYPEDVFNITYFRSNPKPFYSLAHDLQPGKFRPTLTHSFVRLVHEKGLLLTCFTQNIDTLERRAGVPEDKIVEAHGSFASNHCIDCNEAYDDDKMMEHIENRVIPKCSKCGGLAKPDIVFFGEQMPDKFFQSIGRVQQADLLIVIGTSLTVYPFATLATFSRTCPRVLINLHKVGDFGRNPDDVLLLGQCDKVIEKLSKELGWHDELLGLWNATVQTRPTEAEEIINAADGEIEELAEGIRKLVKLGEEPEPDTNPVESSIQSDVEAKSESRPESAPQKTQDVPAEDKELEPKVEEGKS